MPPYPPQGFNIVSSEVSSSPELSEAFPIGSIFLSVLDANPAILLGYGVWTQIAGGRVLVGQTPLDPDFATAEQAGGAKTVASEGTVGAIQPTESASVGVTTKNSPVASQGHTHPAPAYTGTETSVVQPYLVVYIWKRDS